MAIQSQRQSVLAVVLSVAAVLAPVCTEGQELAQPVVNLQFNFADPGARSLGFGGAFVGLADDATAAFANPAGLVQLGRPEISLEGRRTSYSTPYTEGGRAEGAPSGFGIDNTVGLRTARSENVVSGISFFSLAYPQGKWSIAFFRHQLANFEFFGETQGLFGGGTSCCQRRFFDQRTTNDFDFANLGLSGSYRVSETLSLGLGVTYLDASLTAVTDAYVVDDDSVEALFRPNSYLPERWIFSDVATIEDGDWTLTGGFLWHVSQRWNIGGVYRQGPEVETGSELVAGTVFDFGVPPGEVIFRSPRVGVEFPSVFGLGFAYRAPDDRLTVSFQWDHIGYSSIVESLELDDQTVDDADELHLGGEYVFHRSTTLIGVRLGAWLDPDHQLRATVDDPFTRALLPPGSDEMHYAGGVGLAFKRFQIDFGIDFSDQVDTASISAIYSF
ncbi:MAG: hypothetical protein WBP10_19385 [Thermoanaerobaculia bacterium]